MAQDDAYLAEEMRDGDTDSGSDDSDSNAIGHTIEVTTGQVDDNVAPHNGQAEMLTNQNTELQELTNHNPPDQSVESYKDEEDGVWWLELCPEQHSMDVVSHVVHAVHAEDTEHHQAYCPHQERTKSASKQEQLSAVFFTAMMTIILSQQCHRP